MSETTELSAAGGGWSVIAPRYVVEIECHGVHAERACGPQLRKASRAARRHEPDQRGVRETEENVPTTMPTGSPS
jgi:hypothetical protein